MLRWFIKTFLSIVLTISLFGQANPGGGVNIPGNGTGVTPKTCSAGQFFSAVDGSGAITCGAPAAGGGATRGTFAAAPTCNAGASSTTYFALNEGLQGQCNGTSWSWLYGQIPAVPTSTSGSSLWLNQLTASVANTAGGAGVLLTGAASASYSINARLRTVPATPYTYIVCYEAMINREFTETGLVWTDGTNASTSLISNLGLAATGSTSSTTSITWAKATNATTFSASYAPSPSVTTVFMAQPVKCLALRDNGTTRAVAVSFNKSDWMQSNFAAVSRTDFLTPTHVGYYSNSNGGQGNNVLHIFSEEVVASALF